MQIVQEARASTILFNVLRDQNNSKSWLLPANICPIVPITFFKAKIPFEFVDISSENFHMDLDQVEERLEQNSYGGVLYNHTYGESSTPVSFFQRIKHKFPDLLIIDDRCLCTPDLTQNEDMVADLTLYSTGYAKTVDLGTGGYAFLKDHVKYNPERLEFNPEDYEEIERGYKQVIQNQSPYSYRDSDWLQTEGQLPTWYDYRQRIISGLETTLENRDELNAIYTKHLPAEIQFPQEYQTWRFNIRVKNKADVLNAIFTAGLFASSHYASLAGIMAPGKCKQAEILAGEIINLFNDHYFDKQKAEGVCTVILENIS